MCVFFLLYIHTTPHHWKKNPCTKFTPQQFSISAYITHNKYVKSLFPNILLLIDTYYVDLQIRDMSIISFYCTFGWSGLFERKMYLKVTDLSLKKKKKNTNSHLREKFHFQHIILCQVFHGKVRQLTYNLYNPLEHFQKLSLIDVY